MDNNKYAGLFFLYAEIKLYLKNGEAQLLIIWSKRL